MDNKLKNLKIEQKKVIFLGRNIAYNDLLKKLSWNNLKIANNLLDEFLVKGMNKIPNKQLDFQILIANVLELLKNHKKTCISIPLYRNTWKKKFPIASLYTIKIIKLLIQKGYFKTEPGYKNKENYSKSKVTRIWPTGNFLDLIGQIVESQKLNLKHDIIHLKINKKLTPFINSPFTNETRASLIQSNEINNKSRITLKNSILNTDLHAVFLNDFKHGGRCTSSTTIGYQFLSKSDRDEIKFNGVKTIELDFSCMHINLLYAMNKIQFSGDAYDIYPDPDMRPIIKNINLRMICNDSEINAVRSSNYFFRDEKEHLKVLRRNGLNVKNDIVQKLKERHKNISNLFFKNLGNQLVRTESTIALKIIKQFAILNLPILCLHDGFRVYYHNEHMLEKYMNEIYFDVTGYHCLIK